MGIEGKSTLKPFAEDQIDFKAAAEVTCTDCED